jgi:hypothetical protein
MNTSSTKSVITSISIDGLDQNMTKLSNELLEIKNMKENYLATKHQIQIILMIQWKLLQLLHQQNARQVPQCVRASAINMSHIQSKLQNWQLEAGNINQQCSNNQNSFTTANPFCNHIPTGLNQHDKNTDFPPTIRMIQQSINSLTSNSDIYWGNQLSSKVNGSFWIGLRNINFLPFQANHAKHDLLIEDVNEGDFDIFC